MIPEFFPETRPVPTTWQTAEYILRPLTPDHVELDYAALMASKQMLRRWSGSPWPGDDFTMAENLADLRWHDEEHRQRIAFTYTALNPAETACLGCVYIKSLFRLIAEGTDHVELLSDIGKHEAAVRFWVTQPYLAAGLDGRLLAGLQEWFGRQWPFSRVLFHTRFANTQQVALFEAAGLQLIYTMKMPRRGGRHQFWG